MAEGEALLSSNVQEGKVILGTDRVLKLLKAKKLSKIILARNCPAPVKDDIHYYARLANVPVIQAEQTNEELGILCKKNYFVAVAGILSERSEERHEWSKAK